MKTSAPISRKQTGESIPSLVRTATGDALGPRRAHWHHQLRGTSAPLLGSPQHKLSATRNPVMQTAPSIVFSVLLALSAACAFAQSPDAALQSITQEQQDWVNRSCPRSLGPSLWSSCVNREVSALKGPQPDLSKLSESDRNWALRTCPSSLGPNLAISCLSRELGALTAGMPSLEQLSDEKRVWVQQSCPQILGPSLYRSCAEREIRALNSGATPPRAL